MLDRPDTPKGPLRAEGAAPLPVAGLIVGKDVEDAATLLPRLFNLCRTAQALAARTAFGLHVPVEMTRALRVEVLREHLIMFRVKLPRHLGDGVRPLPDGWESGHKTAREAIFGPSGALPETAVGFAEYADAGIGIGRALRGIRDLFAPSEACSGVLPTVSTSTALSPVAMENSVAARQADRPVLQGVEAVFGRGPLWRAAARAYDAQDCFDALLPAPTSPSRGIAVVPAARGTYAISATVAEGVVTDFRRITPTDHLLAKGGVLDQVLASLPARKSGLAPLLLDILDPCTPVRLRETTHA